MTALKVNRKPKIVASESAAPLAEAGEFDAVAQSLGLTAEEIRPRTWLLRIGALLHQMRTHKRLKQEQMAQTAGVTQAYLSRLENGLIPKRGPTVEVLLRCAEAAGCDIEIAVRSRKDHTVIGTVSSADLDELNSPDLWVSAGPELRANPAEVVKVIFEPQPKEGGTQEGEVLEAPEKFEFSQVIKAIEQAQASLTRLLSKYETRPSSPREVTIEPFRSEDLGVVSGEVTSDLVHALEVVWPYRRKARLRNFPRHAVLGSQTVRAAVGDLVIIAGSAPGAPAGSVRISGLESAIQSAESDT
jgi:transcriptional regulator with XRE-family HTH domain